VLAKPFLVDDKKVYLGASIGASLLSPDCDTASALLSSASAARAKASMNPDKISHSFSSSSLDKASREYVELEADLYDAFENGDFEVYFQPKINPEAGAVTGMEALMRWKHPERGFVPPLEFIKSAESNGLIHDLSKFVLEQAIQQLKIWRDMGWLDMRMAVNVSPLDLRRSSIVSDILTTIDRVGVPRDRLEIELTESSLIDSPQRARIVLGQLRDAGVTVAMDDFGTGYSSLSLLADLPLDAVKIDRSFVIGMESDRRCRAIVESVINMAHALDLRVVGEGVETNEALAVLKKLGCHEVQGYLISRPSPAHEITAFLRKQEPLRDQLAESF
jgi:EAL domain-containing protein (putative c-di-GMP-specific phosphodiesterase class I)